MAVDVRSANDRGDPYNACRASEVGGARDSAGCGCLLASAVISLVLLVMTMNCCGSGDRENVAGHVDSAGAGLTFKCMRMREVEVARKAGMTSRGWVRAGWFGTALARDMAVTLV